MKLVFSPEAEADLETIGDYIALDNPARAMIFIQRLRAACSELAEHPRRFKRLDRFRQREVRRRVHQTYLIVYEVAETHVAIVRIVHGAMDQDVVFADIDS